MKIYTVMITDRTDYDMTFEQRQAGCFLDRNKALQRAKKGFEKLKIDYAKEMERYSYNELDASDGWHDGALWVEEDYEGGYYCISYGEDEEYESHQITVDEWIVED